MLKIEKKMLEAIEASRNRKLGNTEVITGDNGCHKIVKLHGHTIAVINIEGGIVLLSSAGCPTRTAKSRLNTILNYLYGGMLKIVQRNFEWYLVHTALGEWIFMDDTCLDIVVGKVVCYVGKVK